jgi:signal transduction histidine kinase/response regulator RpfG family c-di-GMP phosphodiesterase
LWETISAGKEWRGEFCNRKKNGDLFWESAVISPVFDNSGVITNYIAVKEDITEAKSAHDEIIRLSKLQDLLVKLSLRNINVNSSEFEQNIIKSLQEISEFIEAERAVIFKYNWDESTCSAQYEWYANNLTSVKSELDNIQLSDINSWVENHKFGLNFYIPDVTAYFGESADMLKFRGIKSLISVPFFIGSECVGFISFDSIEKKHLYSSKENALLEVFGQIYASLIQRFELEQTLKSEKDNAQKANTAKSEFLANMSHELRTPLNGVIGFSELLMQTNVNNVQLQYASAINSSAKSLLNVINDILDFSKIEAGKLELEIVKCDMIELIEHSIDIIKHGAEKKNLEILLNIPDYLPRYAYIDPIRVSQILINLLGNAVKFTNKGEIELKVNFCKSEVDKGIYTFTVRDTGIGISDTQKLKLFKAFSQADTSTTRRFGGTGLGLSISEKLANKMGSTIQFESKVGEGSVFYFDVMATYESDSSVFSEKIQNIHRVLVIDDNMNSRISIQKMLTNWGIETVICESASEAVFILQMTASFDLVIVDNFIHNCNGLESIRLICKKLNITVDSQNFLLLHAATDDYLFHNECELMGIKYLIEKPLRYDEVFKYLSAINVEKPQIEIAEKTKQQTIMDRKVNILIADDDMFNMMLAKAMVSNIVSNVEISEAVNGKIAMEKAIAHNFDIVFMDVQMPEMDGNEATKAIRRHEKNTGKHTVIVGLTAGSLQEERDKCLDSGMDEFLTKPIDTAKLKETIERILGL